jgi:hypothetical protein
VAGEYVDANGRTCYIMSTTMMKVQMKAKFRKALEDRDKSIAYDSGNLTVERYLVEHWLVHARKREVEGTYRPYEAIVRLAVPCSPVADAVLLTHICSSGSMLEVGKGKCRHSPERGINRRRHR